MTLKNKISQRIKNLILCSVIFFSTHLTAQNSIKPVVDQRVETISIAFRLAGADEYSSKANKKYVEDIETYFKSFSNHPLIIFIKENRNKHGLGYDAVMSMAVHLNLKNKKFSFVKQEKISLEKRWKDVDKKTFLAHLNDFYTKTNFNTFFNLHKNDYEIAENQYENSVLRDFNQNWYSHFYGKKSNEEYRIVLGMANGGGNYGISVHPTNKKSQVYAIVGVPNFDEQGQVIFDKNNYQPLLIHEFNHSFVNYLLELENNKQKLEIPLKKIYGFVQDEMQSQAYGNWEIMMNESIVRAAVVRYMMDNAYDQKEIEDELKIQHKNKFLWTKDLVMLLGEHDKNRKQYPTLEKFYPQIIDFFVKQSNSIEEKVNNYAQMQPKVVAIIPDLLNQSELDPKTKEIEVKFNRKMNPKTQSFSMGESGKEHFPLKKYLGFMDEYSIKIQLVDLEPSKEYEFKITGKGFQSTEGLPLVEKVIKFKTKEK